MKGVTVPLVKCMYVFYLVLDEQNMFKIQVTEASEMWYVSEIGWIANPLYFKIVEWQQT
jgi:hypothetical protein